MLQLDKLTLYDLMDLKRLVEVEINKRMMEASSNGRKHDEKTQAIIERRRRHYVKHKTN